MPQPTAYSRLKNFVQYALDHASAMYSASDHDAEFDAVEVTLDGICTNLALIQRSDGYLKNASVHADALSTATLALIAADWTPRGLWVTATAYVVGDVVQNSTTSYVCCTAHTGGTFATDYAAGKWIILGETAGAGAASITFTPAGNIAATDVQAAIEEVDSEKAKLAGVTTQTFQVAAATAAAHAVRMDQVQDGTLIAPGTVGGTGDAITATLASGKTTLTDGMIIVLEAPGSNTVTAPTLNLTLGSTATGALTIVKGNQGALIAGDIASNRLALCYDSSSNTWVLLNPVYAVGTNTSNFDADSVRNLGIAFSVSGNALTASLKTAAGSAPTSTDPVQVSMRSSSATTGTFATRSVTSALTLAVSSGSTLGHVSALESTTHWYLIDNAGTIELAVSTKFFGYSGIASTTAEGGAGAADSATTMYSTTSRSNVPFVWIARTKDTQTTAGTWASTPSAVDLVRGPYNGSFTITLTGCATAPTYTVNYTKNGSNVTFTSVTATPATGTSNATSKTLTGVPPELRPSGTVYFPVTAGEDAGVATTVFWDLNSSGVIKMNNGLVGGAWTGSGTFKAYMPPMTYTLAT